MACLFHNSVKHAAAEGEESVLSYVLTGSKEPEAHLAYGTLALSTQRRAAAMRLTLPQVNEQ